MCGSCSIGRFSCVYALKTISKPRILCRFRKSLVFAHSTSNNALIILTSVCSISVWIFVIYINLSNDIETNPGPTSDNVTFVSDADFNFKIFHMNIQSILPKIDILQDEMQEYDLLIFTETWLDDAIPINKCLIHNFSPPILKNRNRHGGGLAVYSRSNIGVKRREDLEINGLEVIWVELRLSGRRILIGGIYRPPNSDFSVWTKIEETIDKAKATNINDIYLLGDYNCNYQLRNCKIRDIIASYNMYQMINEPSHFAENSSSIIDLIIVNDKSSVSDCIVGDPFIPNQIRYHCPTIIKLNLRKYANNGYNRRIWMYDEGNYNLLRNKIANFDWNLILQKDNIHNMSLELGNTLLNFATECVPNKIVRIRKNDQPWFKNDIRKLIRQRKRKHSLAKRFNTAELWSSFRKFRNHVVNEIRKAKKLFTDNLSERIKANKFQSKDWWKLTKSLLKTSVDSSYPPLLHNGEFIEDDKEKANLFNSYFTSQTKLDDSNTVLPAVQGFSQNSLNSVYITEQEVQNVLSDLDPSKSQGPDNINPKILKEAAHELGKPLAKLFNLSLLKKQFPDTWKLANVVPVYKKESKNIVSNYRPISLLSCIGKVFERCIYKHMYNFFITNDVITQLQSGFRPGDSSINQLVNLYDSFSSALDEGKEIRVIFFDISKAFDKVWHRGLLFKLEKVGIKGNLLEWIKSYLSDRKQRVVINNQNSDYTNVEAGVPQGSILGPLFFLIYINDITENIRSNIRLFADDTSLYLIIDSPFTSATILNKDLTVIQNWADRWLVLFNAAKTVMMTISRKLIKPIHPPLIMNGIQLNEVEHHKHLGIYFSNDGGWHKHIQYMLDKAWSRVNILRSLKYTLDRNSLEQLYISFIRPLLEYGDVIWDNCTLEDKKLLENVQIESARIVTGATKFVSIEKLYLELGWDTLQKRRNDHKLILFYKMLNNMTPNYLQQLIPPDVASRTNNQYNLRNSTNISNIIARTNLYKNSFLPSVCRLWNDIPSLVRNSPTLTIFKSNICNKHPRKPSYYTSGSRLGQIYQTRLRLECSSLNRDLHKANLVESPLCVCGSEETAIHFLLHCPRFNAHRLLHLSNISPESLNSNQLLSGNSHLSNEENARIFISVQNYILATKRFANTS